MNNKTLGERIKFLNKQKGYNQRDLANAVGISPEYLNQLLNGKFEISRKILLAISRFLNHDFLSNTEDGNDDLSNTTINNSMDLGEKIRTLRNNKGLYMRELANECGVTPEYISAIERGIRCPRNKLLIKIGNALDYDFINDKPIQEVANTTTIHPDTTTEHNFTDEPQKVGVKIPILGDIVAGIPVEAITDIIDYEEIPIEMARCGEYFALRVKGSSMIPKILEGDIAIIRKQEDCNSEQVAAVMVGMENATLKQIKKRKDGIILVAFNAEEYSPRFYTNEEILTMPIRVLGIVVEIRRKFI